MLCTSRSTLTLCEQFDIIIISMSYMDGRASSDYNCQSHSCQYPVYDYGNTPPRDQPFQVSDVVGSTLQDDVRVNADKVDIYGQRRAWRYSRPRRYRRFVRPFIRDEDEESGTRLSSTAIFSIIILLFVAAAGVAALVASLVIQQNELSDASRDSAMTTAGSGDSMPRSTTPRSGAGPPAGQTTANVHAGPDGGGTGADQHGLTTSASQGASPGPGGQTGSWHDYAATNSRFYVSATKLDQSSARVECQKLGGDLASVTDQSEMNFVISISPQLASEDYWFGLYKIPSGSSWYGTAWYDQNTSTYRNFANGFPEYDDSECVAYTRDGFKDKPCSEHYYYTCKISTSVKR